jgi:ABC-type thiamine transport system substrate-binding protein
MTTVHRMTATVLPGGRIELTSPDLPEGRTVTVEVIVPDPPTSPPGMGIADWFASLPPSTRTPEEWAEFERNFRAERDSWDR